MKAILEWSSDPTSTNAKWIVTANPEILLHAKRDPLYASQLRQADYLCVDGIGLFLGLRATGVPVARVTGVELAEALIARAAEEKRRVGFIGGAPGVAEQVATFWKKTFPTLEVIAETGGIVQPDGAGDTAEEEAVHRLVLEAPELLFVAFGGGTKQEAWIARRISDIPSLKMVVGIGGAFDFWTGRIKRAPAFLRAIGLEWVWRLLQEPVRFKRILRATVVFPVAFVIDQFKRSGPARRQLLYVATLLVRIWFFFYFLCPALLRYLRAVLSQGLTRYHWSLTDLIIPFVIFVVLYPVFLFIGRFIDKTESVE